MYAVLPFGIATGLVEVPYLLLQSALFVPIMYFAVGFRMSVDAFILFVVIFTGQRPCLAPSKPSSFPSWDASGHWAVVFIPFH
jgi:hypothetical protein